MIASAALEAGRRLAEQLMVDEVSVVRPSGAVDPITGQPVTEPVYAGKAKVQNPGQPFGNKFDVGGGTVDTQSIFVHIPVGAYEPRLGDVFTVTRATANPYLEGSQFVLRDLHHVSMSTAYRLRVEDLEGYGGASDG